MTNLVFFRTTLLDNVNVHWSFLLHAGPALVCPVLECSHVEVHVLFSHDELTRGLLTLEY